MTVLLVAATGGHLTELDKLAPRLPGAGDAVWVTFDTPQSRSLMVGRTHVFVPYVASRDLLGAMRNTQVAGRIIRSVSPQLVVSTGNAVAASFLPMARLLGIPAAYIESAARADGPSLTGNLLRLVPGVQLFSQYQSWAAGPWSYAGSIFDEFTVSTDETKMPVRRVVVTLGTLKFDFRRLVKRVLEVLPSQCEVLWQVGSTDVAGLGIKAYRSLSATTLSDEMRRADTVIAHAGIGSAIGALEAGKCPILVPRERARGEHVDDHQKQLAHGIGGRNLALVRAPHELSFEDVTSAARRTVARTESSAPLKIAV